MGWLGYSIYGGDDTQTQHLGFLRKAGLKLSDDEEMDLLGINKTKIPKELLGKFKKNIPLLIKKMPNAIHWNEDKALEWQMLAALLLDNKIPLPKKLKKKAIEATEYLMNDHADDFIEPVKRRQVLRKFLEKVNNN